MSDPNSAKTEKKRKVRSKRRGNDPVCISYDDPDLKVVVRLIPPTLPQEDFLRQLEALFPSIQKNLPWTRFFYSQGSRIVQPFEEPKYSRAYFLFSSKDTATRFKQATQGASFLEPESGDLFLAQTMKPIFGDVAEISPASTIGDIASDPLFVKFMALRAAKAKNIDLKALVAEMRAAEKKKTKEAKKRPKSAEKKSKSQTPKLDGASAKAEEPKKKRKRNKKKAKDDVKSQTKTSDAKSRDTTTKPADKLATNMSTSAEAASKAGASTENQKKKKKKSKKAKPQKEATGESGDKPSANPKAQITPDNLSEAKPEAGEKKKSRQRKKNTKPKNKAQATSPTSANPNA